MCISTEEILRLHAARYPLMQPADAVKLLYQNEFGGGHLIADEQRSLLYLRKECSEIEADSNCPLSEPIGNGLVRIHLAAVNARGIAAQDLNRAFVLSAKEHRGELSAFLEKLEMLRVVCDEGTFGFSLGELEAYLSEYAAQDYPMVSHSSAYRKAYHPAYRVILERLINDMI